MSSSALMPRAFTGQRNAGEQDDFLLASPAPYRHAGPRERIGVDGTLPTKGPQPGWGHGSVRLRAAIPMSENDFAVRVQKICRAHLAHVRCKARHAVEPVADLRYRAGVPERRKIVEQQTESQLRIGGADWPEGLFCAGSCCDAVEPAVVDTWRLRAMPSESSPES